MECLIWEGMRADVTDQGFTISGECPISNSCKGESCPVKHHLNQDEQKLLALRKELATLKK